MAWADFGQHVTLTARIREILLNYPEGTSVFKELVQVQTFCPGCIASRRLISPDCPPRCYTPRPVAAQHGHLPSRPRRKTHPDTACNHPEFGR